MNTNDCVLAESCQYWRTSGILQFGEPGQVGDRSPRLRSIQQTFQNLRILVAST